MKIRANAWKRAAFGIAPLVLISIGWKPAVRAQPSPSPLSHPKTLLAERNGYILLPPELIAAPTVEETSASPGGRYLLARRSALRLPAGDLSKVSMDKEPSGEISLVLWDATNRTAREIWRGDTPGASVQRTEWLPGSNSALVLTREPVAKNPNRPEEEPAFRQVLLLAGDGGTREILKTEPGSEESLLLFVSPALPQAVLIDLRQRTPNLLDSSKTDTGDFVWQIGEKGPMSLMWPLPQALRFSGVLWDAKGEPVVHLRGSRPETGERIDSWSALDSRKGLVPLSQRPALYEPKEAEAKETDPFVIQPSPTVLKEGESSAEISSLWLVSAAKEHPNRTLLCADCDEGSVTRSGDVLFYRSQGALWAVPLLKMDRKSADALFPAMEIQAKRSEMLDNGKRIAVALIGLYANDHNQTLPTPDQLREITPYLKDPSVLNGFVYSYKGGPLAGIENPAETEIGYFVGPGGNVVVYADGHVRWKKN
jgi:hypothetical protein